MISTKEKYAIAAMVDIAMYYSKNEYVTSKDISRRCNLSLKYLEQVIAYLVKANLLRSYRGSNGGYGLVKKPEEYTALEIIKATGGDLSVHEAGESQSYIKLLKGYTNVVNNYFSSIKLSDLVFDYQNMLDAGNYYI